MLDTQTEIEQPKKVSSHGRDVLLPMAYGFDDVSLVPDRDTIDPALCDVSWRLGDLRFELPVLAAAMDGVVDPGFAAIFHDQGGLAVLNLEGIHGRYEDPERIYRRIASASPSEAVTLLPELYHPSIDERYVRNAVN